MIPGSFKIIPLQKQPVSYWSGGSTTELMIYPEGSEYGKRNFNWRVSCATLDDETSSFSALDGFKRHLMLLEGACTLKHAGHHEKKLHPYEMDSFAGHWQTTSYGRAKDFNLIYAPQVKAEMESLRIRDKRTLHIENNEPYNNVCVLFFSKGDFFDIAWENEKIDLPPETLLVVSMNCAVEKNNHLSVAPKGDGEGNAVFSRIYSL